MPLTITRADAVQRIAAHLADRDRYVITVPPDKIPAVAQRLTNIPGWTAYLDNGTPAILQTDHAPVITAASRLVPAAAVLTVPKTVRPRRLSRALGQTIPADGSQDILILTSGRPPISWPLIFVDALSIVDPVAASQIRAQSLS